MKYFFEWLTIDRKRRKVYSGLKFEPKNIEIASLSAFPARIAFCKVPLGEEIEFFRETTV